MQHWLLVTAFLALAGCADSQTSEEQAFTRIRGKHISDLIPQWGKPESTVQKPQGTIYTFFSSSQMMASTTSTTTGYVGSTPITAMSTSAAPMSGYCRVNVYTDQQDRVIGLKHSGMNGPCMQMYNVVH